MFRIRICYKITFTKSIEFFWVCLIPLNSTQYRIISIIIIKETLAHFGAIHRVCVYTVHEYWMFAHVSNRFANCIYARILNSTKQKMPPTNQPLIVLVAVHNYTWWRFLSEIRLNCMEQMLLSILIKMALPINVKHVINDINYKTWMQLCYCCYCCCWWRIYFLVRPFPSLDVSSSLDSLQLEPFTP